MPPRARHLIAMIPQKLYHLKKTSMWRKPALEQLLVLLETVRDEHVLERLALLRDLDVAVAVAPLHLVVVVDEEAVESEFSPSTFSTRIRQPFALSPS